jgi:leucine-rich repeat transmembrane protein FLRT
MLCGPSDVVFKKPAILSFQHCAALKQGQWSLSVFYSDSAPEDPPNWQVMKITDLTDIYFQMLLL